MRPNALITAWKRGSGDHIALLAAGVAFFGFLSLFPALIAGILLYGLVASPETVAEQSARLTDLLPTDAAALVAGQLDALAHTAHGSLGLGLAVALLVALWSASGGVGNLVTAVNLAFGCTDRRSFLRRKLLALALTLGAIAFVLLTIALVAVAPAVLDAADVPEAWRWLLDLARWLLLLAAVATALSVLYRIAPDREPRTSRRGILAAAVIWLVASAAFSTYVDNFGSYGRTYGTLAGVVVLLLWLWISAYAVLFGAELESVLEAGSAES